MSEPFFPGGEETNLPPLRIYHFLAWTATAAVLLSFDKLTNGNPFAANQLAVGFTALGSVWESLTLCCLGFGYYWHRQGKEFMDEPGHGLLVIHGVYYVAKFVSTCVLALLSLAVGQPTNANIGIGVGSILIGIGYLFVVVFVLYLYVRFARRYASYSRWRTFYLASVAVMVLQFVLPMVLGVLIAISGVTSMGNLFPIFMLPQLALGVYLAWIVVCNLRENYQFHWSHYAGVAIVLGGTLSGIIGTVWTLFNSPFA